MVEVVQLVLAFGNDHPFLSFVAICFAGFALWTVAESLGTLGRRVTHVHHHHSETCQRNHDKGPCRSE